MSEHQTSFNYVPKAPEFVGTRMPGMASNTTGDMRKSAYSLRGGLAPYAVAGYTGLTPGYAGTPTPPDVGRRIQATSATPAQMSEA